jgi:NAD(P)-dependent dehydrogenase (short-subunit alcohol dehydrogenase family)
LNATQQQTAWITGGGSGIGRALALRLARAGWNVAVSGRRPDALRETVALSPERIHAFPLDVTDLNAVRQTAARIEAELGGIALAVFSAGIGRFLKPDQLRAEVFAEHMRTNYLGVVNGVDAVLSAFRARHAGHIVILASLAGYRGLPQGAVYAPTKAALINLAESLRFALERDGITVSVCNPGFIDTPMTADNHFPMPFLMNVDAAAERLYRGILKRKFEIVFPRRLAWLTKVMRVLPYALYFPLMRRFGAGHRRSHHD